MSSTLSSFLPPADAGWLPYSLLFFSLVGLGNSIQAYTSLYATRQVYLGPRPSSTLSGVPKNTLQKQNAHNPQVTELSARTFGTWTALSSVIRFYAAYNVHNSVVYDIALWTYGIAFLHFYTEWLYFGTARWGKGIAGPAVVSIIVPVWMLMQRSWYVG